MINKRFTSELSCAKISQFFAQEKFPKRVFCIRCNSYKIHKIEKQFFCKKCRYKFSLTTNTSLSKLRISLREWLEIVNCFVLGLSANKTYLFLSFNHYERVFKAYCIIRETITTASEISFERWKGTFEVDESFFGGKFKNKRKLERKKLRKLELNKRGRGAKYTQQPVFGIYKRNGKVFLVPVPDTERKQLERIIKERIKIKSKVYSDKWRGYSGLVGLGYVHSTVDHGKEEYVNGKVHVNGIEGFWGLSKVNMKTYKGIKKKNWLYYLKEMEFRYNYRQLSHDEMVRKIINLLINF